MKNLHTFTSYGQTTGVINFQNTDRIFRYQDSKGASGFNFTCGKGYKYGYRNKVYYEESLIGNNGFWHYTDGPSCPKDHPTPWQSYG